MAGVPSMTSCCKALSCTSSSITADSRAAVFLRQRQAIFGDALVILGGGTGVEHAADPTSRGASRLCHWTCRSGRAGKTAPAARCAWRRKQGRNRGDSFASARPSRTRRVPPSAEIATRSGTAPSTDVASRTAGSLNKIARPGAFYVRLLNPAHAKFGLVEPLLPPRSRPRGRGSRDAPHRDGGG